MTHSACIRFAPLSSAERQPPEWCRPGRNLYQRGGLRFFPHQKDVPLLVDHDHEREIGRVHQLVEWDDIGGPWLVARANVTDAPGWLKRGTKASFAFMAANKSTFVEGWVYNAFVTEVSVLSPTVEPAEPLAQVVLVERASSPAAPSSDRAAGETIPGNGQTITRYFPANPRIVREPIGETVCPPGTILRRNVGTVLRVY